jgi:hypothetical protein
VIFSDMASSSAAVIRHPTNVVWPHLLDQAAWMKDFQIETIDGERHRVGEVKKITPLPGEADFVHFFFKTMLLIPLRRFVYKAYTESREGQYGFTGLEILSLSDFGSDSTVTFEAYLEVQSWTMTQEELSAFVGRAREGSVAMWKRNFDRLASVIANSIA